MWRNGKVLVVKHGAQPPSRCAKCNCPVSRPPIKRTLYWHPSWIYLVILLGLLIYVIVALIVRKKGVVLVPLCEEHRRKRAIAIAVSWGLVLDSFLCFVLAIVYSLGYVALVGLASLLAGIVMGVWKGTLVSAAKIDDSYLWVRGYGPEFLKNLPQWINVG